MIVKKFGVDFPKSNNIDYNGHTAYTLNSDFLGENESGWTIKGKIQEDYYEWINSFIARHPQFGRVWGDFEKEVFADSEKGFQHFMRFHEPELWDYWDI